jgi:SAM-dependent methyltransferase
MAIVTFPIWNIVAIAAGITLFSSAAIYLLFPTFLRYTIGIHSKVSLDWRDRVLLRYQNLSAAEGFFSVNGTFAWVFAWFKLRLDPMFHELPGFLRDIPQHQTALDIGCGYGIAACSLLEWFPALKLYAIEPDPLRVRAAQIVFGPRASAMEGLAPEFENPQLPTLLDLIMVLDVIHFISDEGLELTLSRIRNKLKDGGQLIIRSIIPPSGGGSFLWKLAQVRSKLTRSYSCHRSIEQIRRMIEYADFKIETSQASGGNPELVWFIARAGRNGAADISAVPAALEHAR